MVFTTPNNLRQYSKSAHGIPLIDVMGITQQEISCVDFYDNGIAISQAAALGGGYTRLIIIKLIIV